MKNYFKMKQVYFKKRPCGIVAFVILLAFLTSNLRAETNDAKTEAELGLYRSPLQINFLVPPLGTNGVRFYKAVNSFSLKPFIGMSAATRGVEIGGFININSYYSKGFEISGFGNFVGVAPKASRFESGGVALAGFGNVYGNKYSGIQASGFFNTNKAFTGIQGAGFTNINEISVDAIQIAGFGNFTENSKNVNQIAGFMNVADKVKGAQIAGFMNIAGEVKGVQVAGFMNISEKVKGVQAAGFMNICDSLDGIAIAFINIVKNNGYYSLEGAYSDWAPWQLNYRMGAEKFYNIYSISGLYDDTEKFTLGFGFGHMSKVSKNLKVAIEATTNKVFEIGENHFYANGYQSLNQLKINFKHKVFGKFNINAGPTLNVGVTGRGFQINYPQEEITSKFYSPFSSFTADNGVKVNVWAGFTAGISLN